MEKHNGLEVNNGGCSTANLLKVWYFAILIMFGNFEVCACFPITYIINKKIQKSPCMTCNSESKVAILHPLIEQKTLETWPVSRI